MEYFSYEHHVEYRDSCGCTIRGSISLEPSDTTAEFENASFPVEDIFCIIFWNINQRLREVLFSQNHGFVLVPASTLSTVPLPQNHLLGPHQNRGGSESTIEDGIPRRVVQTGVPNLPDFYALRMVRQEASFEMDWGLVSRLTSWSHWH
jgi:hypothetical protein